MESSDSICKLKNFAKRHDKNEEKALSTKDIFYATMKFFLFLRNRKKNPKKILRILTEKAP